MTQTSVSRILHPHLQMQKMSPMWVPHLLIHEQMDTRLRLCEEALERIAEDLDYIDRGITMDESWVHHHNQLSPQESLHWNWRNEPRQTLPAEICWESSHYRLLRLLWVHLSPHDTSTNDHKCCTLLRRPATVAAPYSPEAPALEKDMDSAS